MNPLDLFLLEPAERDQLRRELERNKPMTARTAATMIADGVEATYPRAVLREVWRDYPELRDLVEAHASRLQGGWAA